MGVPMDFFHRKHQHVESYNIKSSVIILNTAKILKCGTIYVLKLLTLACFSGQSVIRVLSTTPFSEIALWNKPFARGEMT